MRVCLLLLACLLAGQVAAEEPPPRDFYLQDGQTILFLGDSITYGELYVQYIDAFLFTRFPDKRFHIVSRGIPSETVAGTSEPTHVPPRPDLHTRFSSTVPPIKPDVVFACYGMNDGVYLAPNDEVLAKYRAGIERLVDRVRGEAKAEIVLISPPPFDFRPHADKPRPEGQADYRFPDPDYDAALAQFTRWLVGLCEKGLLVVDQHTPMNEHLAARRNDDSQFILSPDGIHPNATGHWLMAQAVLLGLGAPATAGELIVDAQTKEAVRGEIEGLQVSKGQVSFAWAAPLPYPVDSKVDSKSLALAGTNDKLNRYRLAIRHLPEGKYELAADGKSQGAFTASELAAGIDLMKLAAFPTHARAAEVLKLVQQRRKVLQEVWIKNERHPRMASTREQLLKTSTATQQDADELLAKIRQLCGRQKIAIKLRPAD